MFIVGFSLTLPAATTAEDGTLVTIIRDNYGVPHVFSEEIEGLGFGAGYAMAQDRLWQADLYRRSAFGSLAEFGLASIEQDYATRSMGYSREELGEMYENWVPTNPNAKLKEMSEAYIDGINFYILQALMAAAGNDYSLIPIEYLAYELPLEFFTIEDTTAITVMMAWRFGGCGGDELSYAAALQALQAKHGDEVGWCIFNDFFPQNDPGAEVTIPSEGNWQPSGNMPNLALPSNIGDIYEEYEEVKMGQTQLLESLGIPTKFGSNAFMISPSKSTTGNALQVGGPQMGQSIPQIVLEIGLHGAGIDAVGMMMPSAPSVLIGVSKYGAWTSTTGVSDNMDTYIEVLNPEDSHQYLYNGEWVDMEVRTERIYGYKKFSYEDRDIYRTVHGPIIAWDLDNNLAFTMKAPYYKNDLQAEEGWSLFQQARDISEFEEAVKTIQPAHNFYWIDRDGNIGYWHAGTFPIKPEGVDDRLPMWGTGGQEWVGVTGFEEMPRCINPEQGWLTNWNNKPIADWPYGESDAGWGEGHRVKEIMDVIKGLLAVKGEISFEDMNLINMAAGYNHIPGMNLLDDLIQAAKNDPSISTEVVDYLEAWNYHYNDVEEPRWPNPGATYDDPGLTIFDAWYSKIFDAVFEDDVPSYEEVGPIHREYERIWPSTIIHVFDGPDSKLPLNYDYLNGKDRDKMIVRALKEALKDLKQTRGKDMSTWLTPVRTTTFFPQGALPAPKMHAMNRGTYNHIAEMPGKEKDTPHAVDVIPPGQSGFMNYLGEFNHAYDQLMLYETWTYKPMLYSYGAIKAVAESTTILSYP